MLSQCNNGYTNVPQYCVIKYSACLCYFLSFKTLRVKSVCMESAHAHHSQTAGLQRSAVSLTALFTPQWTSAEQRVVTSTWPVGVHSLQIAIWLPFRAVQANTVVAAVCSNLVTKASQTITQLHFPVCNECLAVA